MPLAGRPSNAWRFSRCAWFYGNLRWVSGHDMAYGERERSLQRSTSQDGQDRRTRAGGTIGHIAIGTTRRLFLSRQWARQGRCQFHCVAITVHRHLHRFRLAIFEGYSRPGTDDRQRDDGNHQPRQKTCLQKRFQMRSQSYHLTGSPVARSRNRKINMYYGRKDIIPLAIGNPQNSGSIGTGKVGMATGNTALESFLRQHC